MDHCISVDRLVSEPPHLTNTQHYVPAATLQAQLWRVISVNRLFLMYCRFSVAFNYYGVVLYTTVLLEGGGPCGAGTVGRR